MNKRNQKQPDVYLTSEEIKNMQDDEIVGVSRIAINIRLNKLEFSSELDKEAIEILLRASNKIREIEKEKRHIVLWGAKMTVGEVKRAFNNLERMSKTSFKKIVD